LKSLVWLGLTSCLTLFSIGCGGSGSGANAQLRMVQGSPDAPQVNLLVDGKSVAGNLGYSNATGYISVAPGSRHIQVAPVSGASPIFDQSISFTSSSNRTLLLTGPVANVKTVILKDGGTTATTGDGYVRVVNASPTMGSADVYIVQAGAGIGGVQPVVAGLAFDKDTGYKLTAAGNYQVFMTAPGTTSALLNTGSISLTSGQNQTVVALDGASGGFTFSLLTDQ
jgi:hypothetical protein